MVSLGLDEVVGKGVETVDCFGSLGSVLIWFEMRVIFFWNDSSFSTKKLKITLNEEKQRRTFSVLLLDT